MFGKVERDKRFLIRGHALNELPSTRISSKKLNAFERRRGDDRNGLGVTNLMLKRNTKVLKD